MKDKSKEKDDLFKWAVIQIKQLIDASHFGSITLNMQNGMIEKIKTESFSKPPKISD